MTKAKIEDDYIGLLGEVEKSPTFKVTEALSIGTGLIFVGGFVNILIGGFLSIATTWRKLTGTDILKKIKEEDLGKPSFTIKKKTKTTTRSAK